MTPNGKRTIEVCGIERLWRAGAWSPRDALHGEVPSTEGGPKEERVQSRSVVSHLHRYSERGAVNAVFETIANRPESEARQLLEDLLGRMVRWVDAQGTLADRPRGWLTDFEIYIEPSLSDFGSPDVLVRAKNRFGSDGKQVRELWEAFFFEAKTEPFLMSSPPTDEELGSVASPSTESPQPLNPTEYLALAARLTGCDEQELQTRGGAPALWSRLLGKTLKRRDFYQKNASTIVHELFLKYRFWETHLLRRADGVFDPPWGKGFKAYSGAPPDRLRKAGEDPTVLRLARVLRDQVLPPRFVSLTTDPPPQPSDRPWLLGRGVATRLARMGVWNDQDLGWTPRNDASKWLSSCCLLSWLDVQSWAHENHLHEIESPLEANVEKFTFWPRCAGKRGPEGSFRPSVAFDPLMHLIHEMDPNGHWSATPWEFPWRLVLCRNGSKVLQVAPDAGFTNGFWIRVAADQEASRNVLSSFGLPHRFRLPADERWEIPPNTEGKQCLRHVVTTLVWDDRESSRTSRGITP